MSRTLFVGNLSTDAKPEELEELCVEFGEVVRVSIPRDRDSGAARGFAFIELGSPSAAKTALEALQGFELRGRALRVDLAREKSGRRSERRPPRRSEEDDEAAGHEELQKGEVDSDDRGSKRRGTWKDERHRRHRRRQRGGDQDDDRDW